jgi:cell division protease FtsH
MAYGMVTIYGMNPSVGNVSFYDANQEYGFTKPYSEKTAEMIDVEVRNLINRCYAKTKELLLSKKEKLEELSQILLKREILLQHDLEEILGARPHDGKAVESAAPAEEAGAETNNENPVA